MTWDFNRHAWDFGGGINRLMTRRDLLEEDEAAAILDEWWAPKALEYATLFDVSDAIAVEAMNRNNAISDEETARNAAISAEVEARNLAVAAEATARGDADAAEITARNSAIATQHTTDDTIYAKVAGGLLKINGSALDESVFPATLARDTEVTAAVAGLVAQQTGFRNKIRNGDLQVAQRGAGPFANNTQGVDGFYQQMLSSTLTVTRVALTVGAQQSRYAWQAVSATQSTIDDFCSVMFPIENVETLAGKQVTFSFRGFVNTGTPNVAVQVRQKFGTTGSPSATVNTSVGTIAMSTADGVRSLTFTMPSITGKTIGTDKGSDSVQIVVFFSAGTNVTGNQGIGNRNGTFTMYEVQLEEGPIATPFERLPYPLQLAWCQRYFYRLTNPPGVTAQPFAMGYVFATTGAMFLIPLPVDPRPSTPAFSSSTPGSFSIWVAAATQAITGFVLQTFTNRCVRVDTSGNTGLTPGFSSWLYNSTAGAYMDFSWELT